VLFQEGTFDVRLRSIEAVTEPRSFSPPAYDKLDSTADVVSLIRSTISSGGGLYDKSYVELCIAMYWSVLNTILSSSSRVVTDSVGAVICSGLQQVEAQMERGDSKQNIAWTLRYAMDAVIADLEGSSRTSSQSWLPTRAEASMGVSCIGRTSPAPGIFYDPTNTNEIIAVSPTKRPTKPPTKPPTERPTERPTDSPTKSPTVSPTERPTKSPTKPPTKSPTEPPTKTTTDGQNNGESEAPNFDDGLRSNSTLAFENDSTSSFETDAMRNEMSAGHSLLSGDGIGIFVLGMLLQEVMQIV